MDPCPWPCLLVMLGCLAACTEGGRVVVLPMPFTSHIKYHINVAHELVKLGHEVWLTMPDNVAAKGMLDTTHLTIVQYATEISVEDAAMVFLRDKYFKDERDDLPRLMDFMIKYCDTLLRNESFFHVIRDLRPELIIIDQVLLKMLVVIPYRLGVPFAFVGTAYDPIGQRIPFAPAVTPLVFLPFTDHMAFWDRAQNVFLFLLAALHDHSAHSDAVATYAPEMPYLPLDRLVAMAELWLVELDHILDYPRPTLPNVKLIGGTATGPAKALPPEFRSFMDGATQGVVIVSFGSYVLDLPEKIGAKILQVLLQLPMKSVFRSKLISPDPEKILTSPWLPQNDLLGHPNTKVFVSHCGKNGQYEALYHAVPVVAAPMFADQGYNAERMRVKGFSETIDLRTITASDLKDIIVKVATQRRYKQVISKASELFRIEFGVPMEKAAFWLDHVIKYGGAHMRSAGHDIPYYQFLGLDIAVFFVTVFVVFSFMFVCCCRFAAKCLCRKKQKED